MGGGGGVLAALASVLVLALAGLAGWFLLQRHSAAIQQTNLGAAAARKSRAVVIAGRMGAGKTALWCHLRFPETSATQAVPRTQTSMAVNASEARVAGARVHLVDVPGHQKYRADRDAQLAAASAVVFVVDSVDAARDVRPAAEALYDVLASGGLQDRECPVLVLCNKQDDSRAASNERVRAALEAEIDTLRASRQQALDSLGAAAHDDADRASDFLGFEGKAFSFEDLATPVQFNEASMALGRSAGGLEMVEQWIADALQ
ncbi:hypothetical protein IWQ56_000357 [Coemansia nantahalensis]|uniref:Uncharacterized protein n=1 Tax=Coemansia nantahalensis TaxID=2789366 RepID=A0ACC1K2A4_9FUNG|nr:hypothetical protein IWQ57_002155 [Coemansia nantahalensis]KAJ2774916.1 hypothetical protein IWQ56_000357 [Coemansia nantahalensis]